jgi:YggT family protein
LKDGRFLEASPFSVKANACLAPEGSRLYILPASRSESGGPMHPVLWLIVTVIDIYFWILIAMVVVSWLTAFNIINRSNNVVRQISYALYRLTEPVLGPIRRIMPDLGGLDISPIIAILILQFIRYLVIYYGVRLL